MQGYRYATPARAQSTVVYYPNGRVGRWVIWGFFLAGFVGFNVGALGSITSVSLKCDRASATCSIDSIYPVIGVRSKVIPMSEIKGARVAEMSTKHGTAYTVTLVTTRGDVEAGAGSYDRARVTAVADLNTFFRSKTSPSVEVICENDNETSALISVGLSLLIVLFGWLINQHAIVEVDWTARTLTIVRVRWPIRSRAISFPLETIRDAIVTSDHTSKGGLVYGVSLVTGEGAVPLLDEKSSYTTSKEQTVAAIRALLQQPDTGSS